MAEKKAKVSRDAVDGKIAKGDKKPFGPTGELKNLFHKVANAIHPDFAINPQELQLRNTLMGRANEAYKKGDIEGLKKILDEWEEKAKVTHPEKAKSRRCDQLQIKIRQIKLRINEIQLKLSELKISELYQRRFAKMPKHSQLPRDTLALLAYRAKTSVPIHEYVNWAGNALVDGFDSSSLRILAGLDYGLVAEIEAPDYFLKAVKELKLPIPDCELAFGNWYQTVTLYRTLGLTLPDEATVIYQHLIELAKQIRDGVVDPILGLNRTYDEITRPFYDLVGSYREDLYEQYSVDFGEWHSLWLEVDAYYGESQREKEYIVEFAANWLNTMDTDYKR